MRTGEACNRLVIIADADTSIIKAAELMREHHVGSLVIVRRNGGAPRPVGLITDRDIVIEVIAKKAPLDTLTVADIMTRELITAEEDEDILRAFDRMRIKGVRRLPVVSKSGGLVGLLAVDDMVELLADLISRVPNLVRREQKVEVRERP